MSPTKQRIRVLSAHVRYCALQEQQTRQRLRAGRSRFFSNPTNLLLPFCTGMLVAARFSRHERSSGQQSAGNPVGRAAGKTAWISVIVNALSTGFRFYTRYIANEPATQPASGGAERSSDRL